MGTEVGQSNSRRFLWCVMGQVTTPRTRVVAPGKMPWSEMIAARAEEQ
jgi:hypothetical protein